MNREQAMEIAYNEWDRVSCQNRTSIADLLRDVADALHAAYEAELDALRQKCERLEGLCKTVSEENTALAWREADKFARLASIKETARRIWAAWNGVWESKDEPTNLSESEFKFRSDGAVNMAEMLESAFERRYGGKP